MQEIEELLQPISQEEPTGKFLQYEDLYMQIEEAARADDGLPKGVWEFEEKKADWKRVEDLCRKGLVEQTKDLKIAGWLTQAWLHNEGLNGCARGISLLKGLSERYWENVYPSLEDGAAFRASCIEWLIKKLVASFRVTPLFFSKNDRGIGLSLYHYRVVNHLMQHSAEVLPEHEEIRTNWEEGARASGADLPNQVEAQLNIVGQRIQELDNVLTGFMQMEAVSWTPLLKELDFGRNAVSSIKQIKKEVQAQMEEKASKEEGAEAAVEAAPKPQEEPQEEPQAIKEEEQEEAAQEAESIPEAATAKAAPTAAPAHPAGEVVTSVQMYAKIQELVQTLQDVEPHSPIAGLLGQILAYHKLPFQDLIKKYSAKGALTRIQNILEQDAVNL